MSAIFGMFMQFIYAYENLQEFDLKYNQKPKKWTKKGPKEVKKGKK